MSQSLPQGDIAQAQEVTRTTFFTIASLRLEKNCKIIEIYNCKITAKGYIEDMCIRIYENIRNDDYNCIDMGRCSILTANTIYKEYELLCSVDMICIHMCM